MKFTLLTLITTLFLSTLSYSQIGTEIFTKRDTVFAKVQYTPSQYVCGHYQYDTMYVCRRHFVDPYCKRYNPITKDWCPCTRWQIDDYLGLDKKYKFDRIVDKVVEIVKLPRA